MKQFKIEDFEMTDPIDQYMRMIKDGTLEGQRRIVLEILIDGRPHLPSELSRYICQYNARIYELRRMGFIIDSVRETDNKKNTWFVLRGFLKNGIGI